VQSLALFTGRKGARQLSKRVLSGALALAVAGVAVVSFSAPAFADNSTVVIRKVDTSNMPNVALTVLKPPVSASDNSDVHVSENGKPVANPSIATAAQSKLPMGVVLVIDTSAAAATNGVFGEEKQAAIAMIQAKTPNEQFAVVATNGIPRTVATFSGDTQALTATINGLQSSNQNALWSGAALADGLLQNNLDLQHNVVLLAGSSDQLSPDGEFGKVSSALVADKAVVFTVGLGENVNAGNLKNLALATGGRYAATADASTAPEILTGIQESLADQAVITFQTDSKAAIDLTVNVGNGVATAHASPNTVSEGEDVAPAVVPAVPGQNIVGGRLGLILVGLLALCAAGLLLYGIIEVASRDRSSLRSALRPYSDAPDEHRDISRLADSEIIKKAVAATAKAAEDRGLLQMIEIRLEQADLPIRPAEALFIVVVATVVAMFLGAVFMHIFGIVLAAVVFLVLPLWITGLLARRRRNKFTNQLPDTLQLLAGSLRAGYSLVQGLDAVSKQAEAPMGPELLRAMGESRLGRPAEDALQEVADRMGSDDFTWAVMAIKIQREVGGNLAELLMTVSETMIARERMRREVKALTAEGRISAIVLAGLPPIIGAIISVINPGYMAPMYHNFLGQIALGVGTVMIIVGYWFMMKMIQVEA
jgi:tight adherence protein B